MNLYFKIITSYLLLIVGFLPTAHAAKIGNLVVHADRMERDTVAKVVHLKGHVQVLFKDRHIKTETATIFLASKEVEAKGEVIMLSADTYTEGRQLIYNYEKDTGVIYDGFVQMGQVSFEGKVIYKTGPKDFEALDGQYTACTTCPPSWSFTGSKITGTFGGSALIRNPVFRIATIPVFWFPAMIVPLSSKRQTGFLFPVISFGDQSGMGVEESFYWVMADNQDSTWTVKNYQKRGLKGTANYRYVLSEGSSGEFETAYIHDRLFAEDDAVKNFRGKNSNPINRWQGKYRHYYDLPEGYVQRLKVNHVSDNLYGRDFSNEINTIGEPALESSASLTRNTDDLHWSIDLAHNRNLLKTDPFEDNSDGVHKMPHLRVSKPPTSILDSNFLFDFDAQYVSFTRDGRVYDNVQRGIDGSVQGVTDSKYSPSIQKELDGSGNEVSTALETDGSYNPGHDIIRAGQRLNIKPRLSYPIRIGPSVDLLPSVSYQEARYQFNIGTTPSAERRLMRGQLSARTYLNGFFGDFSDEKGARYKHEFRPEITYTNIPWMVESEHPFFGRGASETNYTYEDPVNNQDNIQFDYFDRIYERNLVTLSFTNTFTRRNWNDGHPSYRQLALFRLSQSYDVYEEYRATNDLRLPWSPITAFLDVRMDHFDSNSTLNYFPYHGFTTYSSRARVFDSSGNYFQTIYSQNYTILKKSFLAGFNRTETQLFQLGSSYKYFSVQGNIEYLWTDPGVDDKGNSKRKIRSVGGVLALKPPGDCWQIVFNYSRPSEGESSWGMNFNMNFGAGQSSGFGYAGK